MAFTQQQVQDYDARQLAAKLRKSGCTSGACGVSKESKLHEKIREECARRGWIAFGDIFGKRSTSTVPGEPDFRIAADKGRNIYIECKKADGKPTTEQLGVIAWLRNLGHEAYIIRSMEEFYAIVDGPKPATESDHSAKGPSLGEEPRAGTNL